MPPRTYDVAELQRMGDGKLPGLLGLEVLEVGEGLVRARMEIGPRHHAPNGYLHASSVIGLVDTACGYGCMNALPDDGVGFTTIELKCNFLGTLVVGTLECEARLAHGGRTTQVWDATARAVETGKTVALFRCTQLVLRAA